MLTRRRFWGSISSIIFSMLIIVGLVFGPNTVQAKKVFHMKVSSQMPPGDSWALAQKWYYDQIMAKSDGRLKFQYFFSASLTKVGKDLAAVNSGLEECALIAPGYTPTETALSCGLDLAYTSLAADAKSKAILTLYKESEMFRNEWMKKNNCQLLWVGPSDILGFYSRKPMPTLDSIKGKKVRTYGMVADAFARVGGTPVSLPISGSYEAANRGIVNAVSGMGLASAWVYKIYEPCPYVIDTGYGQYCQPYHVMNLDVWNSLPEDLQQLFIEWAPRAIEYNAKMTEQKEKEAMDDMQKRGMHMQVWSDADKARAKALVQPAQLNSWIKKQAKIGLDLDKTRAFMERYIELLEKFERESSWVDGFTYWRKKYGN